MCEWVDKNSPIPYLICSYFVLFFFLMNKNRLLIVREFQLNCPLSKALSTSRIIDVKTQNELKTKQKKKQKQNAIRWMFKLIGFGVRV